MKSMLRRVPTLQDAYAPISAACISRFEEEHQLTLPEDYKDFLLASNGGLWYQNVVFFNGSDWWPLWQLYGINTGFEWSDLALQYELVEDELPRHLLPIGHDANGNPLLIVTGKGAKATIRWWDHEMDTMDTLCRGMVEFFRGVRYSELIEWREKHPAFHAVETGNLEKLIEYVNDLSITNSSGWTLLGCAVWYGQLVAVEFLLEHGADVNARFTDGTTPLHLTTSVDIARLLIHNGAEIDAIDASGVTPLCQAVYRTKCRVAILLIQQGANVNHRDDKGRTLLSLCDYGTNKQYIFPELIRFGAVE